jgi:hypothetical protein
MGRGSLLGVSASGQHAAKGQGVWLLLPLAAEPPRCCLDTHQLRGKAQHKCAGQRPLTRLCMLHVLSQLHPLLLGCEVAVGQRVALSNQKVAFYTWHGATVEVQGKPDIVYVC